jgi:hypothetical protein
MAHIIFGLFAVAAGLAGVFAWWDSFGLVLRGLLPIALVVVGLVATGAGLIGQRSDDHQVDPL